MTPPSRPNGRTPSGVKGSRNPANDCDNFEQYLRTEVNPEKLYPLEYALALAGTSADGPPSDRKSVV